MRWWGWVIVFIVIYWALHNPVAASNDVHGISNFFSNALG